MVCLIKFFTVEEVLDKKILCLLSYSFWQQTCCSQSLTELRIWVYSDYPYK
jgi:hypothetical protein